MLDNRIPPQDLESEKALLGGLLIAHQFERLADCDIDEIRSIVGPEMFYAIPEHRLVFQAIVETHEASEPIDPCSRSRSGMTIAPFMLAWGSSRPLIRTTPSSRHSERLLRFESLERSRLNSDGTRTSRPQL